MLVPILAKGVFFLLLIILGLLLISIVSAVSLLNGDVTLEYGSHSAGPWQDASLQGSISVKVLDSSDTCRRKDTVVALCQHSLNYAGDGSLDTLGRREIGDNKGHGVTGTEVNLKTLGAP